MVSKSSRTANGSNSVKLLHLPLAMMSMLLSLGRTGATLICARAHMKSTLELRPKLDRTQPFWYQFGQWHQEYVRGSPCRGLENRRRPLPECEERRQR